MKNNFYNKRNISLRNSLYLQRGGKAFHTAVFRAQLTLTMQTDNIALIGAEVIHIYDTLSLHSDCLMFALYFPRLTGKPFFYSTKHRKEVKRHVDNVMCLCVRSIPPIANRLFSFHSPKCVISMFNVAL